MNFIKFAGLTALVAGSFVVGCSSDDTSTDTPAAGAGGTAQAGAAGSTTGGTGGTSTTGGTGGTTTGGTGGSTGGSGGSAAGAGGNDGTGTGPAAKLLCTSSGKNAYETYGSAFVKVRDSIIGNVANDLKSGDPGFGHSFDAVAADPAKLNALEANLADFLVFVYGGPNNYKGKSMTDAHATLAITQAQYDYFLANDVVKALSDNGVPMGDISSCFAPPLTDPAFEATIVTVKTSPPGPGASLKCTSSGKNAYDTYGAAAFGKVRDSIVTNVATELGASQMSGKEPGFGTSFNAVAADPAKLNALEANLGDFLIYAYGGPNNYKGKSMKDAHATLAITQAQYDYFLANDVVKALSDNGVPMGDVSSCFAPTLTDPAFEATIVTK